MRMRTIPGTYRQHKIDDPNSSLTLCGLRRFVREGIIPTVNIGRKKLLDYDQFLDFLRNPPTEPTAPSQQPGTIRRVD
jgi:hypothetical protein